MIAIAPVTPRKDIYRKEAAQKRRLQTDLTAGEKLQSTSVVSRDQEVLPKKGELLLSRINYGLSVVENCRRMQTVNFRRRLCDYVYRV